MEENAYILEKLHKKTPFELDVSVCTYEAQTHMRMLAHIVALPLKRPRTNDQKLRPVILVSGYIWWSQNSISTQLTQSSLNEWQFQVYGKNK